MGDKPQRSGRAYHRGRVQDRTFSVERWRHGLLRTYWRVRWAASRRLHRGRWPMPEHFDRMSWHEFEAFSVHIGFDARIRAALAHQGDSDATRTLMPS